MKFIIDTKALKQTKKNFDKLIDKKSNPYIKLSTQNNFVELAGTSSGIYLKSTVECEIIENGKCFVKNDQLQNILKHFKNKTIIFEIENDFLKIIEDKTIYKINYITEGFVEPNFLSLNYKKVCDINNLKEAIEKTDFAISKDQSSFFLNGLFFDINQECQRIVATNGHILIYKNISIENYNLEKFTEILPKSAVNLLKNNLLDTDKVEIFLSDKYIKMIYSNNEFYSNLIDSEFPEYRKVLPEKNDIEIGFNKKDLLDSIKKISTFLKSSHCRIYVKIYCRFDFDFISQKLKLSRSEEGLFIEDFVDFKSEHNQENIITYFDLNYLFEIINSQSDNVIIKLKEDGTGPAMIGDNDYYSLIIPVKG